MRAEQFAVTLQGSLAHLSLLAAGGACIKPTVNPVANRYLIGIDVLAGIARADQFTQFLSRLGERPAESSGVTLAPDAIAQPKYVLSTLIDAAIAIASLAHLLSPCSYSCASPM